MFFYSLQNERITKDVINKLYDMKFEQKRSHFIRLQTVTYSNVDDNVVLVILWWWQFIDVGGRMVMPETLFLV